MKTSNPEVYSNFEQYDISDTSVFGRSFKAILLTMINGSPLSQLDITYTDSYGQTKELHTRISRDSGALTVFNDTSFFDIAGLEITNIQHNSGNPAQNIYNIILFK